MQSERKKVMAENSYCIGKQSLLLLCPPFFRILHQPTTMLFYNCRCTVLFFSFHFLCAKLHLSLLHINIFHHYVFLWSKITRFSDILSFTFLPLLILFGNVVESYVYCICMVECKEKERESEIKKHAFMQICNRCPFKPTMSLCVCTYLVGSRI